MRVIGVTPETYGGPEALQIYELPDRHADPGTVRVAVHDAAVNPTDTVVRAGWYPERQAGTEPPFVPGMDVAGIVDEIGPDTETGLAIGDQVMAMVAPRGSHGGYSDSLVLPAWSVTRVPAGVTLAAACTLPMNGLTARRALDMLGLPTGATMAVTGAAGTLGGYVVQLAKAEGLRVIADSSEQDEPLVRGLGPDVVVRRGDDVAARIREVVPDGVDGVVDAAVLGSRLLPAIRDGGALASVRPFEGATERGIVLHQVWVREYRNDWERLDRLRQQVEDGVITLRVADTFPPERAGEAHARLECGGTRGRFVIQFRNDPA